MAGSSRSSSARTEVDQATPLFKVDDAQLHAQVAQLEAQRDLAQQALARAKDLALQNASSTADLEKAEAEARSAQAQYDLQRIRLERTTVRAPFAGVVGQRYVSLGDYVTTTTRLASLHTVNPQRASFQVPSGSPAPCPRGRRSRSAWPRLPVATSSGRWTSWTRSCSCRVGRSW